MIGTSNKSVPEMAIDFLNKSSYIIYKWNIFHGYVTSTHISCEDHH